MNDLNTTSYELSLRLKELGVEQTGGEYYWCQSETGKIFKAHFTSYVCSDDNYEVLCRAFTLGELVRMGDSMSISVVDVEPLNYCAIASKYSDEIIFRTSPEEAAGELLAEIKSQEKQKA